MYLYFYWFKIKIKKKKKHTYPGLKKKIGQNSIEFRPTWQNYQVK